VVIRALAHSAPAAGPGILPLPERKIPIGILEGSSSVSLCWVFNHLSLPMRNRCAESVRRNPFMLREHQHERKIINVISVRPET